MKEVTFLLPAYNEEKSIGNLISKIKHLYPYSNVIVVDNNSIDGTARIAEKCGAKIIFEKKQGKAYAMKKGFQHSDSKYVVMIDADNTYDPKDARKLIEPLKRGDANIVLGSRFMGNMEDGAISNLNFIGNCILSMVASFLFTKVSDVCTGYWAFDKKAIDYLLDRGIKSSGFEIEAEMFAKISKGKFKFLEIPITYRNRIDEPKLSSLKDGFRIFKTLWIEKITKLN
ncbi:MAG: glycosyltransferase [Methanobacterium sp.]|uniref:glycosyltransferase family 2 protein n=1 Tax=Methanobacterium sp. TaxID=2164 RepID=UPI003D6552A2|nr:glycosyltransferase [Methanobacterium sp.]